MTRGMSKVSASKPGSFAFRSSRKFWVTAFEAKKAVAARLSEEEAREQYKAARERYAKASLWFDDPSVPRAEKLRAEQKLLELIAECAALSLRLSSPRE